MNDNGNEIQYKCLQCGGQKLFISQSAVYKLRDDRLTTGVDKCPLFTLCHCLTDISITCWSSHNDVDITW